MSLTLGKITTVDCVAVPTPPDTRCDDEAFRLANPGQCPEEPRLILKPGLVLVCELGSVQFSAFTLVNGVETNVTSETVFTSSDLGVIVIGASSGNATGVGVGTANISATHEGVTVQTEVSVLAGTKCCDQITVAMMVVVDQTRSMKQAFPGYATKLAYAKAAAVEFINTVNQTKDTVGLERFTKDEAIVLSNPVADKASVSALVAGITQTDVDTTFFDAITAAVAALDLVTADRKVILLISDGEDTTASYVQYPNPIAAADDFRASGGIIFCLGVRAHGPGYSLLSAMATGGFFLNAYADTAEISLTYLIGLRGYVCGGRCGPAGDSLQNTGQLSYATLNNWYLINTSCWTTSCPFAGADQSGCAVDLFGSGFHDYLPGNGLYVSLIPQSGLIATVGMVSKSTFSIVAGKTYRLSARFAGNQIQPDPTAQALLTLQDVAVSGAPNPVGPDLLLAISDYTQGFQTYGVSFVATATTSVRIFLEQSASALLAASPRSGILVDHVKLENITAGTVMLLDDFEENLVYTPPACGPGTYYHLIGVTSQTLVLTGAGTEDVNGTYSKTNAARWDQVGGTGYRIEYDDSPEVQSWYIFHPVGVPHIIYFSSDLINWGSGFGDDPPPTGELTEFGSHYGYDVGYNCYGDGCLDSPPPSQLQDPHPLPFLEGGFTPAGKFTATESGCAKCDDGFVNVGQALTATELSDGGVYKTTIQLPVAKKITRWQVNVKRYWHRTPIGTTMPLLLEGSNDNVTWDAISSKTYNNASFSPGLILAYVLSAESSSYAYYRVSTANATGIGAPVGTGKVLALSVYVAASQTVCKTATATGASKAEAKANAVLAAKALAQAALNCIRQYTATEVYSDGSVTCVGSGTSQNSQEEAQSNALTAAQENCGLFVSEGYDPILGPDFPV